ncbi:hypothetical protein QOT17_002474 [Balamuthia mandrillaris]
MAAVRLNHMMRLLSGSSDGNPIVRPLQRFLIFTQIANLLVIIGVVIGIIMFKEVEERAPLLSALVFCLLSVLLQLFYYHAAGSASGVKQALVPSFFLFISFCSSFFFFLLSSRLFLIFLKLLHAVVVSKTLCSFHFSFLYRQQKGLAFIIISLVLSVLGALNLLVFSSIYMLATKHVLER